MAGGLIVFLLGCGFVYRVSTLMIKLENGQESPSSLDVIENSRIVLTCDSAALNQRLVWRKVGDDTSFKTYTRNLTFVTILTTNGGNYICTDEINADLATVTINVLYPPTVPVITGPSVVLKGHIYNLTCNADANPKPTFQWTTVEDANASVVARGRTFVGKMEDAYTVTVYCWVKNLMFPTYGKSQEGTRELTKAIVVAAEPAYIWELYNIYTFNVSTDVSVECRVTGSPPPEVWWTRQNDSTFRYNGARLFVRNVQLNFAGFYSCYAKNTVSPTGQSPFTTEDVQHTLITINDIHSSKLPIADAICDADCKGGLIAAAIIGWLTTCVLLVLVLLCFIKSRNGWTRNQSQDSYGDERKSESNVAYVPTNRPLSGLTNPDRLSTSRPVLPVRPGVARGTDENPYSYVTEGDVACEPSVCLKTTKNADYLEPVQDPGDYLQL